jgi:hypothetical protein
MARNAKVNLRVRPTLKAKLEKLAKEDRRTLSAYVEKLLEDHVIEASSGKTGLTARLLTLLPGCEAPPSQIGFRSSIARRPPPNVSKSVCFDNYPRRRNPV